MFQLAGVVAQEKGGLLKCVPINQRGLRVVINTVLIQPLLPIIDTQAAIFDMVGVKIKILRPLLQEDYTVNT